MRTQTQRHDGFFSYARISDEIERGKLTALGEAIVSEIVLATGNKEFIIFQDTQLQGGEKWREKIIYTLQTCKFFIAVIEPSYLKSSMCRDELKTFLNRLKIEPDTLLFLPIYYRDCGLEDTSFDSTDELLTELQMYQYRDWRQLRDLQLDNKKVKEELRDIAERIKNFMKELSLFSNISVVSKAEVSLTVRNKEVDVSEIEEISTRRREATLKEIAALEKKLKTKPLTGEERNRHLSISARITTLKNMLKDVPEDPAHLQDAIIVTRNAKYTLIRRIGSGATGEVWQASSDSGKSVAIKLLHPRYYDNPVISSRFIRGAQYQKDLLYDGIVKVIDGPFEDEDSQLRFFVMEYIEGRNLRDMVLDRINVPSTESYFENIRQIFISICGTVEHIHTQRPRIAHRDLCPTNILVDQNGKAYLTDFDNIQLGGFFQGTNQHVQLGTYPYSHWFYFDDWKNMSDDERIKLAQKIDVRSITSTLLFCLLRESLQSQANLSKLEKSGWIYFIKKIDCSSEVQEILKRGGLAEHENPFTAIVDFSDVLKRTPSLGPPSSSKPQSWIEKNWRKVVTAVCSLLVIIALISVVLYMHKLKNLSKEKTTLLEEQSQWLLADQKMWNENSLKAPIFKMFRDTTNEFNKQVEIFVKSLKSPVKNFQNGSPFLLKDEEFFDRLKYSNSKSRRILNADSARHNMDYDTWASVRTKGKPALYVYDFNYAIWSPARHEGKPTMGLSVDADYPSMIFAGISLNLVNESPETKNDGLSAHLGSLLRIPRDVCTRYLPTMIFVGYAHQSHMAQKYMLRFPAYNINNLKMYNDYDPTEREWWKAATGEHNTINFDPKNEGRIKRGLCFPYDRVSEGTFPPRGFWYYLKTDSSETVFGVNFIFDPLSESSQAKERQQSKVKQ